MVLLINILEWEACKILMEVLSVDYTEGTLHSSWWQHINYRQSIKCLFLKTQIHKKMNIMLKAPAK